MSLDAALLADTQHPLLRVSLGGTADPYGGTIGGGTVLANVVGVTVQHAIVAGQVTPSRASITFGGTIDAPAGLPVVIEGGYRVGTVDYYGTAFVGNVLDPINRTHFPIVHTVEAAGLLSAMVDVPVVVPRFCQADSEGTTVMEILTGDSNGSIALLDRTGTLDPGSYAFNQWNLYQLLSVPNGEPAASLLAELATATVSYAADTPSGTIRYWKYPTTAGTVFAAKYEAGSNDSAGGYRPLIDLAPERSTTDGERNRVIARGAYKRSADEAIARQVYAQQDATNPEITSGFRDEVVDSAFIEDSDTAAYCAQGWLRLQNCQQHSVTMRAPSDPRLTPGDFLAVTDDERGWADQAGLIEAVKHVYALPQAYMDVEMRLAWSGTSGQAGTVYPVGSFTVTPAGTAGGFVSVLLSGSPSDDPLGFGAFGLVFHWEESATGQARDGDWQNASSVTMQWEQEVWDNEVIYVTLTVENEHGLDNSTTQQVN